MTKKTQQFNNLFIFTYHTAKRETKKTTETAIHVLVSQCLQNGESNSTQITLIEEKC